MGGQPMNARVEEEEERVGYLRWCTTLHRAVSDCHRRTRDLWQREVSYRHLNRSLAECIVSASCPTQSEAIRSMCASAGTAAKRAQCQQTQISLSICISNHQQP